MKHLPLVVVLMAATMLSSCLHFVEEITIRKDGSGRYRMVVDASEIKKMADGFGKGKKKQDPETAPPGDTATAAPKQNKLEGTIQHYKLQPGLSKVEMIQDSANYQSGFSFDFDRLENFEAAMKSSENETFFGFWDHGSAVNFSGKNFTRVISAESFQDKLAEMMRERDKEGGREKGGGEGFIRMMFGSLTFKQVYHFPDQKIKKCNYKEASISPDKHTLTITEKPFDADSGKKNKAPAELNIRLK